MKGKVMKGRRRISAAGDDELQLRNNNKGSCTAKPREFAGFRTKYVVSTDNEKSYTQNDIDAYI